MDGYSVLDSILLLAFTGLLLTYASRRPRRVVELALSLLILATVGLWFLGYNPRTSYSLLFEVSAVAFGSAFIFMLVQYGRRELAEGEYDEPPTIP